MKHLLYILFLLVVSMVHGQHQDKVNFFKGKISLGIHPENKSIQGSVNYSFVALEKVDSVFLDAKNMRFFSVLLNNKKVKYKTDDQRLILYKKLKKNKKYSLQLNYRVQPKQTVYFIGWDSSFPNKQVWTQGQGKYTSHWLPSFDDMTEKVIFDMEIRFDKEYEVIANGVLQDTLTVDGVKTWRYSMNKPMSSYLLAFAIGDYEKKELSTATKIPVELYYYPQDSALVAPTYKYTQEIFDFFEKEIGVPYPWQNYKQIPVRDFLYAGMENTSATIFSDAYMIDSIAFKDRNFVSVNAHEMAHQWFGNLVTQESSGSHWLHEGFATYYALLAEKEIFGTEYYYWKIYESAKQLTELSVNGQGESLLDPTASSLTFYEKGAWALHILREDIGESAFKEGVKRYLRKFSYKNANIEAFLAEMAAGSGKDLSLFKEQWLQEKIFPFNEAKESLKKGSESLAALFNLEQELITSPANRSVTIQKYWNKLAVPQLRSHLVKTYYKSLPEDLIKDIFNSQDIMLRQAIAIAAPQIPIGLKDEFESLLEDHSYITIEHMLYKLWINFPQDRSDYLEKTKEIVGLPNKNVRMLWLTLALLTKDFEPNNTAGYFKELSKYTAPEFGMEVRQNAFQLLRDTLGFTDNNLLDLINASQHHSWQFKKFSRNMLKELLGQKEYRKRIISLSEKLNEAEKRYIINNLGAE
ncbi:M1 family metallopeptidase [Arenibacter sp. 6A1]|uniref:M1 family metallopeptidase n=1 Tax=Arenibacter sp. 6A1 TaxID=2720391 RepID=UPI001447A355|nr:M1 family metallopeptidase [Arenibacter sp. 6A1]NKI25168.1 M1 family metallopeptidase [Arenibacter sp. 6A1]